MNKDNYQKLNILVNISIIKYIKYNKITDNIY